ncbi:M56 family metallopeptidase [Aquisphaera giovannonii]|nr:M56 family metallopeptidase [Aquisphaera giovannonii]
MHYVDLLDPGSSEWAGLAWRAAWQSTAILAPGLAAGRLIPMRPARAHRILLAATLACLIVPAASLAARRLDVGLFQAATTPAPVPKGNAAQTSDPGPPAPAAPIPAPVPAAPPTVAPEPIPAAETAATPMPPPRDARPWRLGLDADILIVAWAFAAALGLARIVASFVAAVRIRARSRPVVDPGILATAGAAARDLGLPFAPRVRASADVRCPAVWCWGRRPVLIVPDRDDARPDGRLAAILCHELAHWMRADHLSALAAELLTCLMPWQPLAWLARHRMAALAELACDDWALAHARSVSPDDYVEALLNLATGRRRPLVPAAASGRSGLVARARHILEEGSSMPRTGRLWNATIAAACIGLVATLALAQTRQAKGLAEGDEATGPETTVEGIVRDDKGRPIPGAEVVWIGDDRFLPGHIERPLGHPDHDKRAFLTMARGVTDGQGRFTLRARIKRLWAGNYEFTEVIAHKPGLAPGFRWAPTDRALEVVLEPAVPIVGHLLTPGGEPAADVAVRLTRYDGARGRCQFDVEDRNATWRDRPGFLPGEFRSDASGRFVIDGYVPAGRLASIDVRPAGYAPESLTVAAGDATGLLKLEGFANSRPLPQEFTHTLAEDRPVVGTVTDEVSHEPLAGVKVGLTPMHGTRYEKSGTAIFTTTDAKGRYRFSLKEAADYDLRAYPDADFGYQGFERTVYGWPAGERELKIDVALRRAHVVRGEVIDEATGVPVPDATIGYQNLDPRSDVRRSGDYFAPFTTTDSRGRFAIAAATGPGVVRVDASNRGYVRFDPGPVDYGVWPSRYIHGQAQVVVPAEGTEVPPEVTIKLKKGLALQAKAVRPDGTAAEDARAWCAQLAPRFHTDSWLTEQPPRDGHFRLPGAEPGRTYRVFFLTDDLKYGAVAEIQADPARTWATEVKLRPTASMHGRLLDGNGQPLKKGQSHNLTLKSQAPDCSMPQITDFALTAYTCFPRVRPQERDNPADFRYVGLIPGVRYTVNDSASEDKWRAAVEPLKPGEDRDLGDIRPSEKGADLGR